MTLPTRGLSAVLAAGILLWGGIFQASAILNASSQSNTNAPPNGAPWDHVGGINGASGVYLAAGWALTAAHVGAGNLVLGTSTLAYAGVQHRLTNSDGSATDLLLIRLSQPAPLPSLPLADTPPEIDSSVVFIGFGHIAGAGPMPIGNEIGFTWAPGAFKSWGDNKITATNVVIDAGLGDVTLFSTDFDDDGQTPDECQATNGDSGGGAFQKNGATWRLLGVTDLVSSISNQPPSTSVFGTSSYAAQICNYRDQILAWLASTPPVLTALPAGGRVEVCWPDPGVDYTLQTTLALAPAAWDTVPEPQVFTGGMIRVSVAATNAAAFFRLKR